MTAEPNAGSIARTRQEESPPQNSTDRSTRKPQATEPDSHPTTRCLECGHEHGMFDRPQIDTATSACPSCGATAFAALNFCSLCDERLSERCGMAVAGTVDIHCIECIESGRSDHYSPRPAMALTDGGKVVPRRECFEHDFEEFRREQITPETELVVRKCQRCGERDSEFVEDGGSR